MNLACTMCQHVPSGILPLAHAAAMAGAGLLVASLAAVRSSRTDRQEPRSRPEDFSAWAALKDNMSTGLVLTNADDEYVYVSGAAETMFAVPASTLEGKSVHDTDHAFRIPLLLALDLLRRGKRPTLTGRFPMNDRMVVVEFSRAESDTGKFEGAAAVIRDMTEDCEFCGHMISAERMTVIGELAAAMAHEINSPLSGVMESVRIIRKNEDNWPKVRKFLPLVQQGLEQIAATVRQMLKFAIPHEPVRTKLVLEDLINHCAEFLGYRQHETGAELRLNLHTEHTEVIASAQALSQVLINLTNNAFDAVEGIDGAFVEVRSEFLPESGEVMVQVVDNGPGVPPNLRARIFEPFFTTKPSGKGTGLGLSICTRLTARKGGRIIVSDAEGGGAVFTLVLPVVGMAAGH